MYHFTITTPMKNIIVLHTTVAKIEDARKIAQVLLSLKLVACAQIDGPIESIYRWKDSIETEQEYRLSVKSTNDLAEQVIEKIKAIHPYELAEIGGQPLMYCSEDYKNWVFDEVNNV
ncbi:MAG: periplasmic divalent cation tolerance protein [Desulforhopalus sp.]|jgi:periplasmic divalent cation tolerance protein